MNVHYAPQDHIPIQDTPAQAYAREFHAVCGNIDRLHHFLHQHDKGAPVKGWAHVSDLREFNARLMALIVVV